MKTNHFFKKISLVASIVTLSALVQAQAVGMAAASGTLADIAVMAVQAKANLAGAASAGDIGAIAEATKRADAVDAAMADAMKAFSAKENAQDQAAEDAADEALATAREKADNALNGPVPDATPQSKHDQWKESQTNTGGGPGDAYDPPNIYDVPWQTAGLRSTYSSLFTSVLNAGGGTTANSNNFGDGDATPE